ncbi:hydroxyacylglutathione hydrolase [Shewanella sp.]|uniref:hydroxyacylglutathione hydrolase n=1 Tax=Shewanella sp. TaxID=50422 RepID=UPI004053FFA2
MLSITEIPAFNDNYIWILGAQDSEFVYVVDPGTAAPVLAYLNEKNLTLAGILITHKHQDHVGGIRDLQAHYQGNLPVYGPKAEGIEGITHHLIAEKSLCLPHLASNVEVIHVPGHTLGHFAYLIEDAIFCGDTLFSAGCGRLFEGTPEQMLSSLNRLASLPAHSKIYCAHEYTQANLNFALTVTPNNPHLVQYASWVTKARDNKVPTIPAELSTELTINPFLRCHTSEVKMAVAKQFNIEVTDELQTFTLLRKWKDHF